MYGIYTYIIHCLCIDEWDLSYWFIAYIHGINTELFGSKECLGGECLACILGFSWARLKLSN